MFYNLLVVHPNPIARDCFQEYIQNIKIYQTLYSGATTVLR